MGWWLKQNKMTFTNLSESPNNHDQKYMTDNRFPLHAKSKVKIGIEMMAVIHACTQIHL